jgi:hypothetical protein
MKVIMEEKIDLKRKEIQNLANFFIINQNREVLDDSEMKAAA